MQLTTSIFDLDGTLAKTEEAHRQAFNETFGSWGLDWHWDRSFYSTLLKVLGGKERLHHYVTQFGPPLPASGMDDCQIAALHKQKTQRYGQMMLSGSVRLCPGIETLIRSAKAQGFKLAIATTSSIPNFYALMAATFGQDGMWLFDAVGTGDTVVKKNRHRTSITGSCGTWVSRRDNA